MLQLGEQKEPSPSFNIRTVGEAELEDILEVYRQCEDFLALGPVPKASSQMVLDDLAVCRNYGGVFAGIFIGDRMVGVVDYVLHNYEGNPNHAYLSLLMIAAPYRRFGLGKRVVEVIEDEILQNRTITAILSGVQVNNPRAIAFWTSLGYEIVGGPELMPDTTTVYRLQKDINI